VRCHSNTRSPGGRRCRHEPGGMGPT